MHTELRTVSLTFVAIHLRSLPAGRQAKLRGRSRQKIKTAPRLPYAGVPYFPGIARIRVSSGSRAFTALFGMGRGGTRMSKTPANGNPGADMATSMMRCNASAPLVWGYERPISTARLSALPRVHLRPINVIISHGPMIRNLEVGFALRCFQRLSLPNIATQRCSWRNSWYTRGSFIPVLSY